MSTNPLEGYIQKFVSLLVLYFFLVFPLIYSRSLEDAFEFPRQYVLLTLAGLGFALFVMAKKTWKIPFTAPFMALTALMLFSIVSALWAHSPILTSRRSILFLFQYILLFVFVQFHAPYFLKKCRFALILSLCGIGALALFQLYYSAWLNFDPIRLGISPSLGDWRDFIQSSLGNTDFIAGLLCLFFPFLLLHYLKLKKTSLPWLAVLFLWLLILIISWSVSALFSLAFFFFIILIFRPCYFPRGKKLAILFFIAAVSIAFWGINHPLNPLSDGLFRLAFASERWHLGGVTRIIIWENALQIFRQNIFTGTGFNNFIYLFPEKLSPYLLRNPEYYAYAGQFTNAVHNDAFQIFTELGLPGGLLFLFLCLRMIREGWQKQDYLVLGFFSLFLLNSQMSFPFLLIVPSTLFCFMTVWNTPSHKWTKIEVSPVLRGVCIILCLGMFFLAVREFAARSIYKQVRNLQYAEQQQHGSFAEKIRHLDFEYHRAKLEVNERASQQIRQQIDNYTAQLPTRMEQLHKLEQVFRLSPYYYDASSRFADMLLQHQMYQKAAEIYEHVIPVLNTNDVYWGYLFCLLHLERYEEAEHILSLMANRLFRPKDYNFAIHASNYLKSQNF